MQIEGKKNLDFLKRALLSHLVNCSGEALRADDKKTKEVWDPEIEEINKWLDATEKNLEEFKEEENIPLAPFEGGRKTPLAEDHSPLGEEIRRLQKQKHILLGS